MHTKKLEKSVLVPTEKAVPFVVSILLGTLIVSVFVNFVAVASCNDVEKLNDYLVEQAERDYNENYALKNKLSVRQQYALKVNYDLGLDRLVTVNEFDNENSDQISYPIVVLGSHWWNLDGNMGVVWPTWSYYSGCQVGVSWFYNKLTQDFRFLVSCK